MIRAGSLIYALCITLILSILSGSLILLAFNTRTVVDNNFISEKQIRNISSALNYYLTSTNSQNESDRITLDLFDNGNDSVEIEKRQWGALNLIHCKAHQGDRRFDSYFLIGDKPLKKLTALYLGDQNKPLALCGKTIIRGDCFLPKQGVKRAYIEGQSFSGKNLIDGNTQKSLSTLPDLDKNFRVYPVLQKHTFLTDSVVDIQNLEANKIVSNPFSNKTLILTAQNDLELDNYQLQGNIIIQCDRKVTIKSSSFLTDILIQSKSIAIEKNFSGTFQGFASDSIIVGEDVQLNYPSSLLLTSDKEINNNSKIVLMRRSSIKGNVVNFNSLNIQDKSVNIRLNEECLVEGLVYSNGYVDLKGTIIGSLYCNGFILKTPSAVYENHLLNASINSTELPEFYVGSFPIAEVRRKAVIKRVE